VDQTDGEPEQRDHGDHRVADRQGAAPPRARATIDCDDSRRCQDGPAWWVRSRSEPPRAHLSSDVDTPHATSYLVFGKRLAGNFPADSTYGPSTLQSLRRGSSSELDYLNGEIVTLGEQIGRPTPVNTGLLEQGRAVFATGRNLSPEELLRHFKF
jgi:hypothetical protein